MSNQQATNEALFDAIEHLFYVSQDMASGIHQWKHNETIETTLKREIPDAQAALVALRQRVMQMEALSDAVEELSRIEKAYTRLSDNTWPEWDGAYDAMYAINQEIRKQS